MGDKMKIDLSIIDNNKKSLNKAGIDHNILIRAEFHLFSSSNFQN